MKPRWSADERARLHALHAQGLPVTHIARRLDRTPNAVYAKLRPASPPLSFGSGACPPPATLLDAFLRKPSGTPLPEGLPAGGPASLSFPSHPPGSRRDWTPEDIATLCRLIREQNLDNAALAQHFNVSRGTLANALHRYGVTRRAVREAGA